MKKKILPIVIDNVKNLSINMSAINIAHIYCNINDDVHYDEIKNGIYQYINKCFFTCDEKNAINLKKDFPSYRIFFIGVPKTELPHEIEIFDDVNEQIFGDIANGICQYTNREIRSLKNDYHNYECYDMDIILAGHVENSTSITKLKNIISSIKNNKIIANKYVIKNINVYYGGTHNKFLVEYLGVDHFVEMNEYEESCCEILKEFASTKLYDLIDRKKHYYYWETLRKILDVHYLEKKNGECPKIILTIDISQIDTKYQHIDFTTPLENIIDNIRDKKSEMVYLCKDVIAIGTQKVMKYYMMLHDVYGSYRFKNNIRSVKYDGIFDKETYEMMSPKMTLRSDTQLFEHIHGFSDIVMTKIHPLNDVIQKIVKPKKIIIVTYYGFYEQFEYVKKIFVLLGYEIYDFPYMKNMNDNKNIVNCMSEMIETHDPQYILWWVFNVDVDTMSKIVQIDENIRHLYFNWDEPYNWDIVDAQNKAKYLDSVFVTCSETLVKYTTAGTSNAYCQYPGYCPTMHYPYWIDNNETDYDYDITFICTNLYDDKNAYPDQIIDRKTVVEAVYNNQKKYGYKFAIFGPEKFRDIFPDSYQGFIKYKDTCNVINRSKINMCTHVVGNKKGYLNERVFLIMGTGGLLFVDPVPGVDDILVNGLNCIFINENKIVSQINCILDNYSHYENVKKNAYNTSKKYTWDDWGMNIEEKLLKDFSQ